MHWYTADLHLNHAAILRHCKRPFRDAGHMDSHLCDRIAERVAPDDDLWIVGDFAFARTEDRAKVAARLAGLPGRKHLVHGNHDESWVRDLPWDSRHDIVTVRDGDQALVLCHYPMITWEGARHGALHLFGHVHDNWLGTRNAINVGVDVWDYAPVRLPDIQRRAKGLKPNAHWRDVEPGAAPSSAPSSRQDRAR